MQTRIEALGKTYDVTLQFAQYKNERVAVQLIGDDGIPLES